MSYKKGPLRIDLGHQNHHSDDLNLLLPQQRVTSRHQTKWEIHTLPDWFCSFLPKLLALYLAFKEKGLFIVS